SLPFHNPHPHRVAPVSQHAGDTQAVATVVPRATHYPHSSAGVEMLCEPHDKRAARPFHEIDGSNGFIADGEGIPFPDLAGRKYLQHGIKYRDNRSNRVWHQARRPSARVDAPSR